MEPIRTVYIRKILIVYNGTYIRWELRMCCARVKENISFLNLNKCRKQIKLTISINTCAPFSELPSNISTMQCTVCPRGLDTFYIVPYNIKWVKTSWTYSTVCTNTMSKRERGGGRGGSSVHSARPLLEKWWRRLERMRKR